MKRLLIFIILLCSSFLYAQDSWVFDDENADIGTGIFELKQFKEDYILSISYTKNFNAIKIHDLNTGEIVDEAKFVKDTLLEGMKFQVWLAKAFFDYNSENIYIFGRANRTNYPYKSYIVTTKWDFDLNLVSYNFYKASDNCSFCNLIVFKTKDGYELEGSMCNKKNQNQEDYDSYPPLFARFDSKGNLVDSLYINDFPENPNKFYHLILKKQDNKGYWAFDYTHRYNIVSYDNSFNVIEIIEPSFWLKGGGLNMGGNRFDDSSYVVGFPFYSQDYDNYGDGTQIIKFDNNLNVLKRDTFVPEDKGAFSTFLYDPIDWYYKDHIYMGGFYFFYRYYFCISKYDSDLNLVWRKFIKYKDKDKYFMMSMEATSDSCIVVGGNRKAYDSKMGERTRKPFIMKISPNGSTVSTEDIEETNWAITVYPNPSSGDFKLYVEGTHKSTKLHISDMQGRQIKVINNITQGENYFNFGDMPKGMYVWTLEDKGGVIGSWKWVKK